MHMSHRRMHACSGSTLYLSLLVICVLWLPFSAGAQNDPEMGLPFITNYSAKTYRALPQTWVAQQDDQGIMYFGIQGYLLQYDGVHWKKLVLGVNPGQQVMRSLAKGPDGHIYYGGLGDVGFLEKDSSGQTRLHSLLPSIPEADRQFQDVYSTHSTGKELFFQSREAIFRMPVNPDANGKRSVTSWKPRTKFMYAFYLDGQYYVHQQSLGMFKLVGDSLQLIPGSEFLGKERVQVMLPYDSVAGRKRYLVGMFYSGIFLFDGKTFTPFTTEADPMIKSGSILYKALLLRNGNYALATTGKGLAIISHEGKLLQRINRDVGLQDESIYGMMEDSQGNLWLSLDNGISRLAINSPLTQFTLQSGINTGVLAIARFNKDLYLGTTNGLLKFDPAKSFFNPVPKVPQNQIFTLLEDVDQLLIPGDGLFSIRNGKPEIIHPSVSADLTISGMLRSAVHPGLLIAGGGYGIAMFTRNEPKNEKPIGQWVMAGYVPGVKDQIWTFSENADGTFWAGTQAGLVYLVKPAFDANGKVDPAKTVFEIFGKEQGLENALGAVANIGGKTYTLVIPASTTTIRTRNASRWIPRSAPSRKAGASKKDI